MQTFIALFLRGRDDVWHCRKPGSGMEGNGLGVLGGKKQCLSVAELCCVISV